MVPDSRLIKTQIIDLIRAKRQQPLLIVDEASLPRLDLFAELHTITQFEGDSKPWLPLILAGQNNLADNLSLAIATFRFFSLQRRPPLFRF